MMNTVTIDVPVHTIRELRKRPTFLGKAPKLGEITTSKPMRVEFRFRDMNLIRQMRRGDLVLVYDGNVDFVRK